MEKKVALSAMAAPICYLCPLSSGLSLSALLLLLLLQKRLLQEEAEK